MKDSYVDIKIEDLLFKIVGKPSNYLDTRIVNVYDNRYRVNVYRQIEEDNLTKRRMAASYFCHYSDNQLNIVGSGLSA